MRFPAELLLLLAIVLVSSVAQRAISRVLRRYLRSRGRSVRGESAWWMMTVLAGLFTVAGVCFLFFNRPLLALGVVPFIPLMLEAAGSARRRHYLLLSEQSTLSFLYALKGLLASGLALPVALLQLSSRFDAPFARSLVHALARFERGGALRVCVQRFTSRSQLKGLNHVLELLFLAHARGLSLVPILEQSLPILERRLEITARTRVLERSAITQAVIAGLVPWTIFLVLKFFQPQLFAAALISWKMAGLVASVFIMELMGAWCIFRVASFQ